MYPVLFIPSTNSNGGTRHKVHAIQYNANNKIDLVTYFEADKIKTAYDIDYVLNTDETFNLDLTECVQWEERYDNLIRDIQSDIELETKSSERMAHSIAQTVTNSEEVSQELVKDYIELNGIIAGKLEILDKLA